MHYRAPRPNWDHDHCVACWAKFAEFEDSKEPIKHEGYTTCSDYRHGAEYDWVCLQCFADFMVAMEWRQIT